MVCVMYLIIHFSAVCINNIYDIGRGIVQFTVNSLLSKPSFSDSVFQPSLEHSTFFLYSLFTYIFLSYHHIVFAGTAADDAQAKNRGDPTATVGSQRTVKRRDSRRHTLANGVDFNMVSHLHDH